MNIVFFPVFTDNRELTDHYYRLYWYLYPFRDKIDQITLLCECECSLGEFPDYLDPSLLDLCGKMPAVQVVDVSSVQYLNVFFKKCDVILLWKIDPEQPDKIPVSPVKSLLKSKRMFRVDHSAERFSGSFYLKISELFPDEIKKYVEVSRDIFDDITEQCRSKKGYIFGTGPNLSLARNYDFSDGVSIACNSMVRNRALLDRLRPPLIVIGDPIFHAGPSSYAAAFRSELVGALDRYDSYLIVPLRDYHIYKTYLPSRFHSRIAAIPYKNQEEPNLDLAKNFYVASTANVLTLFLIPLASTFFKDISLAGCDGRSLDEDGYFWGHDKASQFSDQMEKIKQAHPAFFVIDYNDYYMDHCNTLGKWLTKAEEAGNTISNLTPSYIPALRDRYTDPLFKAGKISEVIMLDPDALDHFGHYLSFDDKLHDACESDGIAFTVFGNVNCSSEVVDARPFFEPVFNIHSWALGNRPKGPKESDLLAFSDQLRRSLRLRKEQGLTRNSLLYMYCGSLPAARAVRNVLNEFENVSAVICLFWLSFVDYRNSIYVKEWGPFLQECMQRKNIVLTVPTKRLAIGVKEVFGVVIPVAPHPSTTFSDIRAEELFGSCLSTKSIAEDRALKIIFPGGPREEKGFCLTAEYAPRVAEEFQPDLSVIVRALVNSSTPYNMEKLLDRIESSGCVINADNMDDERFAEFLKEGDIIVLPYLAPDFSERTSGLLIDALYLGKPVIVWENTWLADVVEEYKNGVIVNNNNYSSFKDALIKVVDNLDSFSVSARKAQIDYFKENSWARFVDSIVSHNFMTSIISNDSIPYSRENKAALDETRLIAHLLSDLPSGSVMIDVGGHHGSALAPFARMKWKVFAFEPDPENRKYLEGRYGGEKNIVIDCRAVGETAEAGVAFYASEESTGISGMLAFRESHKVVDTVDVTTVADIITDNTIGHVHFLKIDVEGYDYSVLKGVPWGKVKPDVIECEFEDAKTRHLGHTWRDICEYLVANGYTVYVSEWHPIVRYGIRHDWLGIKPYPCELEDQNAWGNLLAFRNDPGATAIQDALCKVVDVQNPGQDFSAAEPPDKVKPELMSQSVFPAGGGAESESKTSKKINRKSVKKWSLPHFTSYAHFAEWVQSSNLTIFRIGQVVMWLLRYLKRFPKTSLLSLMTLVLLVLAPVFISQFAPYVSYFWTAAGVLVFSAISVIGVSFGNKKMMEFAAREHRNRQVLRSEITRELKKELNEFSASAEVYEKQQVEVDRRLSILAQKQDELAAAFEEIRKRNEESAKLQNDLLAQIDLQRQHEKEHYDRLVSSAPVFNFGDYQSFNRRLTEAHVNILQQEWSSKLGLKFAQKSLAYLAHRICTLESASRGRLATSIEDAVLRVLVSAAARSKDLRVLEIGTLFGIGLSIIHDYTRTRFNSVHLTAIDPLDGYYGKGVRDIVTEEAVDEQTFMLNLAMAGVPEQDYTLIKSMSSEDSAIESAAALPHDVLIIDGDHSYEGVKADFVNYLPAVRQGGYIIFDDYDASNWPGVKEFIDTCVLDNPEVRLVGKIWRTAVFQVVRKEADGQLDPE